MTNKRTGVPASAIADEQFLHALFQGGELLASGKVSEAKEHLERAYDLRPRNEKAQNLLGLTYFKLGLFERAAEIYEVLVRENPTDPTLRVNLGLVYLKDNALQRAIREFEIATDLAPDHQKAQNYLGLALAQAGQYGRAREHFVLAGSDAMVQRMDRALAGEIEGDPISQAPRPPEKQRSLPEPPSEAIQPLSAESDSSDGQPYSLMSEENPPEAPAVNGQDPAANGNWNAQFGLDEPPPPSNGADQHEEIRLAPDEGPSSSVLDQSAGQSSYPAEPPPEFDASFEGESEKLRGDVAQPLQNEPGPVPSLPELAPSLQLFGEKEAGPFVLKDGAALIMVEDQVLSRAQGLVSYSGVLEFIPEMKRFRGRATDRPFGEGSQRVMRIRGRGVLIFEHKPRQHFLSVDLGDESVYFREPVVFAFQERVMFENGRVPSETPPDLDLVHLRGSGKVLLSLVGPLRTLEVQMNRPVTLPLQYLVGWHGNITPRMLVLPWETNESRAGIELQGEGFALFASPLG